MPTPAMGRDRSAYLAAQPPDRSGCRVDCAERDQSHNCSREPVNEPGRRVGVWTGHQSEAGEGADLPTLPSVRVTLTICSVCIRNAHRPFRERQTPSMVLQILLAQGTANMLGQYHRLLADCQYNSAEFTRTTSATLVDGIIK